MPITEADEFTVDWNLYQKGVDYKQQVGLYETVNNNYRFFQGDQWHGVNANGLPTPVFNIIKPVIRYKVSTVMQNEVKIRFVCENYFDKDRGEFEAVAEQLTGYTEKLWEQLKMDYNNRKLLFNAAITGDGITYFYYDDEAKEVKLELVDSVNVYPANPNISDVQDQDYIIISFRKTVSSVRREAIAHGMSEDDAENIVSDDETTYQAGDNSKIELNDSGKCIVLLKMWRDNESGTIKFRKSTKTTIVVDETDTGCTLYPVALFNWEEQKNSFHGVSDVTELIPNQVYVNKIAAMVMLSTMYTAFPKMVYDENLVDNPSNQIGVAIGVNGSDKPIGSIIDYITPASVSGDAFNMFERTIALTKELMGANDTALGNVNPETASGKSILAVAEQSTIPLENIRQNFYNYIENVALIIADMWHAYTTDDGKEVYYQNSKGQEEISKIKKKAFEDIRLNVRIDVGPSSRWNEFALSNTLENLLNAKHIPFEWYVEMMPENVGFPKQKLKDLITQAKEQQVMQARQQQAMQNDMRAIRESPLQDGGMSGFDINAFVDSLPEDIKRQAIENPALLEQLIAEAYTGKS